MAPESPKKPDIVIARSKRTKEKYPARTSHLEKKHSASRQNLHYIDHTCLVACRCIKPWDHGGAHPATDGNKHTAIAITRYLNKFNLESCNLAGFCEYTTRQKLEWAASGVRAERFHYSSKDKAVVCRCNKPGHLNYKRVHNPEIQELCAEFFQWNTTETTCTREQWRAVTMQSSKAERILAALEANAAELARKLLTPESDSFEYDSSSVIELLRNREERPRSSRTRHSCKSSRKSAEPAHLSNGPNGEADIPEGVWRRSRPSVYLGQHDTETVVSTPLGSNVVPVVQEATPVSRSSRSRSPTLDVVRDDYLVYPPTNPYSVYATSATSSSLGSPIKHFNAGNTAYSPKYSACFLNPDIDIAGLEVNCGEISRPLVTASITSVSESSPPGPAVELDATPAHSPFLPHYSPTLKELEVSRADCVAELTGGQSSIWSVPTKAPELSRRLTRLTEQQILHAQLPSQEDLFLHHVVACSRANPALAGDCPLCHASYHEPNSPTIQLTCGHFFHQPCLVSSFRCLDHEYGNCSVCGMAVCERTLADRIATDRAAIFSHSSTHLKAEQRIYFAQRNESVTCWSEEELAAAHLRLLKDYIDVHADELWRQWLQTCCEPEWENLVVRPVVQLFKGWNLRNQGCRYFANRDVFYNLVVWAELVRLMNTTRDVVKRAQSEDAAFPQLSGLHRKFMVAKERYEMEKRTGQMDCVGVSECEKVAQDAFSMAVSTYLGSRT